MKNKIGFLCLLLLCTYFGVSAQDTAVDTVGKEEIVIRKNIIKTSPLLLGATLIVPKYYQAFNLHYERALSKNRSLMFSVRAGDFIRASAGGTTTAGKDFIRESIRYSGIGLKAQYRFYLNRQEQWARGLYAAPVISATALKESYFLNDDEGMRIRESTSSVRYLSGGIVFGYQAYFSRRITLDISGSMMYNKAFWSDSGKVPFNRFGLPKFLPGLDFTIGYSF